MPSETHTALSFEARLGYYLSFATMRSLQEARLTGFRENDNFRAKIQAAFDADLFQGAAAEFREHRLVDGLNIATDGVDEDGRMIVTEETVHAAATQFLEGGPDFPGLNAATRTPMHPAPMVGLEELEELERGGVGFQGFGPVRYVWEESRRVCIHDFEHHEGAPPQEWIRFRQEEELGKQYQVHRFLLFGAGHDEKKHAPTLRMHFGLDDTDAPDFRSKFDDGRTRFEVVGESWLVIRWENDGRFSFRPN